ncbi:pectinesterase inhibitor-like [Vigna radiata var. radiata]|uniref:Pectinesterase inhibitor-like n=1 Tax=Vigna radiata var. radiata TaxID=3916 RepID=A0A1S3VAG0_VIGRR|nr:pectinesterase inhibitor-like [Vigna radiata var. radiata]
MDQSAKLLVVLALCVTVMANQAAALAVQKENLNGGKETPTGKTLINKVCSDSPTKNLCVQVLSSEPLRSPVADLKDLALISLRVAATNASGILADTKILIDDDELDPDIQQGLADCKENILDAESQLEDTIAALMVNSENDAQRWLKAALAAIDTCDASIPGDDDVLSVESAVFRKLCNIAILVIKELNNPTKS